jgi:hypothetical protein
MRAIACQTLIQLSNRTFDAALSFDGQAETPQAKK